MICWISREDRRKCWDDEKMPDKRMQRRPRSELLIIPLAPFVAPLMRTVGRLVVIKEVNFKRRRRSSVE